MLVTNQFCVEKLSLFLKVIDSKVSEEIHLNVDNIFLSKELAIGRKK